MIGGSVFVRRKISFRPTFCPGVRRLINNSRPFLKERDNEISRSCACMAFFFIYTYMRRRNLMADRISTDKSEYI